MAAMTAALKKYTRLSMDIEYRFFETHNSPVPYEVQKGFYRRYDSYYHSKLAGFENVITNKYAVYIDSSVHNITLSTRKPGNLEKQMLMADLDKAIALFEKIETLPSKDKKVKGYRFWCGDDGKYQVSHYDVYFFTDTYLIKQVNLFYNYKISTKENVKDADGSQPRMEIVFNNVDISPSINESSFNLDLFVKGSGKKFVSVNKYKGYSVSVL
jgi:hypothetical protein